MFEIDLAMKRVELTTTCSKVIENPSKHLAIDLSAIANAYVDLMNTQWREMIRGPFEFQRSLSEIMKSKVEPMKRRI